jgi:drug/metabolite transporter (DMT)-like permease
MKENRRMGILLLVGASVLWSTSGVLIKGVEWDGFAVAGFRSLFAGLTILAFTRSLRFRFSFSSVAAVFAYACTVTCIGIANKNTTAANAVLLQFTSPIYSALLGWKLLKEKVTIVDIVSIIVILCGMSLFVADGLSVGHFKGDLLALVAGVSFGSMCVFLRLEKDSDPVQCTLYGNFLSFLISVPFVSHAPVSVQNIGIIAVLGVFQLGISYVMFANAVKHVTALQANLVPVIEPLLNPVWVMIFLHESPGGVAVAGGCIVLSGMIGKELWNYFRRYKEADATHDKNIPAVSCRDADRA